MKKTLLMVALAAVCGMAQAKILRVNNTTSSGAPYTKVDDALTAAEVGDTIMMDGSNDSYGNITINKKVVLMGPGYWRSENGVSGQGESDATLGTITISATAQGTVLRGLNIDYIKINANNVVINRCRVRNDINVISSLGNVADNCIIHQNYISGRVLGYSNNTYANYTQITNNIFNGSSNQLSGRVKFINAGYIAYNTFANPKYNAGTKHIDNISACTLTKNVFTGNEDHIKGNSYEDNYMPEEWTFYTYNQRSSDLTIKNEKLSDEDAAAIAGKGAFNGDDPYVISGIPAGPVIQDLTVPVSVEQGNNLNITIKLGVQK